MVIQNLPSGYIGSVSPSVATTFQSTVQPISETTSTQTQATSELKNIESEIRSREEAIKNLNRQSTNPKYSDVQQQKFADTRDKLVDQLKQLQQSRSDLIKTGNAYTTQLINIQAQKNLPQPIAQQVIQPTMVKQVTAEDLVKTNLPQLNYKDILTRTPETFTQVEVPTEKPFNVVKRTEEVFGKPTFEQKVKRTGEELITKGKMGGTSAGLYTVAGGGLLLGKGIVEGGKGFVEEATLFKPISQGRIPFVSSTYEFGKGIITGEVQQYAQQNPLEFTGQIIGGALVGKVASKIIPRLSDTKVYQTNLLEAPIEKINVFEPDYTVTDFTQQQRATPKGNYPVFIRESTSTSKFTSAIPEGDFKLAQTNYIPNVLNVGEIVKQGKVYTPITTLSGDMSFVPKKGFLSEKGVILSFTPKENPFLYYGQQRLNVPTEPLKFVDITQPSSTEISPYVKGTITNIPTSGVIGNNFIAYREYSRFFPIKQGILTIENVEQTGEGISRYEFRQEIPKTIKPFPFFERSDVKLGEGFGFVEPTKPEIRLKETQLGLGSFFGDIPESQSLVVKSSKLSKPFSYDVQTSKPIDIAKNVQEVFNTEGKRQVLRQKLNIGGTKPIDVIALGKIESPFKSKIEFVESIYGQKYKGAKVSFIPEEEVAMPKSELSKEVFGKKYESYKISPQFMERTTADIKIKTISIPKTDLTLDVTQRNILMQRIGKITSQQPKTDIQSKVSNIQITSPIQQTSPVLDLVPIQQLETKTTLITQEKTITPQPKEIYPKEIEQKKPIDYTPSAFKPKEYFTPTTKQIKTTSKKKSKFITEVKKKGKFEPIAVGENLQLAFQKGLENVRQTASASTRVIEEGKGIVTPKFIPSDFGFSKKLQGVIVQKREKRISSFGEKLAIPYKGQQALRMKRTLI